MLQPLSRCRSKAMYFNWNCLKLTTSITELSLNLLSVFFIGLFVLLKFFVII
jgi:hypothetical protein